MPEDLHGKVGDGEGLIPERAAYALKNYPPEERRAVCERAMAGALKVESMEPKRKKPKRDKLEAEGIEITFPKGLTMAALVEIVKKLLSKLK